VSAAAPEITVAVASHDRPIRLRWLLNALEEQTLDRRRFEVIVAHDSRGPETEELLRTHALAAAGVLRHISFVPGPGPAAKRNAAWRAGRAQCIAFTDDDCRPPGDWLERALAAAGRHPGAVVQGATRPDPDEAALLLSTPHAHTQDIDPPSPWAETCNIVYPRRVLEALGGFDESLPIASGEDTDLALRARAAGVPLAPAPDVLTYHAVEPVGLLGHIRGLWRWRHIAAVVERHPSLRRDALALRVFWQPRHAWLLLALAGLATARRRPAAALLAAGWVAHRLPSYGPGARGRLRALAELPGLALVDAAEVAVAAAGSVRYRTLLL
jgi:GT2 family glycosyltransferase